jgi:hypothetical protein
MTKSCARHLLFLTLLPAGAWAQRVQNMDIFFLAGPSFAKTQTIGGSNVTVYGSTGYSMATGVGYQFSRESAVGLWIEFIPFVSANPAAQTATIPGSISPSLLMIVPSLRVMVPVQSRISVYGAVGAGWGTFNNPTLTSDNPPKLTTNNVTDFVASFGGGVDVRLIPMLSLRFDTRDYVTGRNLSGVPGRNHILPMFGFAFHF